MEKTQKTKPLILQRKQEGTAREKGEDQRSKERVPRRTEGPPGSRALRGQ